MPEKQNARFLILGCQRSGTTLLRLILNSHSGIHCYDELKAYSILSTGFGSTHKDTQLAGFKIPRWTEQLLNPVLFDEGLESSCPNFYDGEKLLFMVRDVRDVLASMQALKAGNISWHEQWPPRILLRKVISEPRFRERYAREFDLMAQAPDLLTAASAFYWKYKTEALFRYSNENFPVMPVFYEDLIRNPRSVLESVCRHLEIPWEDGLLQHNLHAHDEVFEGGLTVGGTNSKSPIHDGSIGRWRNALKAADLEVIERITADTSQRLARLRQGNLPLRTQRGRAGMAASGR